MAAQDELFQLIQSLSPSEKRYFKVNASKGGDAKSNYMQLFEAVDAMKEYDEDELKKKHGKKPFVKYLSAEKKQLREQILRQMRSFHSSRTVDNRINELLQDEAFFRDKGLKAQREKTIQKAKEIATQYERFHLLQEILEREIAFVTEFEEKVLTEPVLKLITELKQLSLVQETRLELWAKSKETFAIYRSGADAKDPMVRNRLEMLIAEVERYRSRLGNYFHLNSLFVKAYNDYHYFLGNAAEAFAQSEAECALYQKHPQFKDENPIGYKICLANLIGRAYSSQNDKRFLEAIEEMKSLPAASFNDEGEVFQNVYFSEHLYHMNKGDFEKAESLVPDIQAGLETFEAKINKARLLSFQFNIMVMYFLMHRFKEAATWADKILDDKGEIKQGIQVVTRILYPIIHFELGHHDLVENLTRAAYRYLLNKKRLHEFERLMVNYLKQMPFTANDAEFKRMLQTFNEDLSTLMKDSNLSVAFGMEEMKLWSTSRLHGQKMTDLIRDAV